MSEHEVKLVDDESEENKKPESCCEAYTQGQGNQHDCALCQKKVCEHCVKQISGQPVCATCAAQVLSDLADEQTGAGGIVMGAVGACIAAIISGIIWATITISTGFEVGYVAIGVGWLVGMGAFIGSGRKTGKPLQLVSIGGALLGLLLAKYFMLSHQIVEYIVKESGEKLGYLNPEIINMFFQTIGPSLSGWDILWAVLAISTARNACAPTEIALS